MSISLRRNDIPIVAEINGLQEKLEPHDKHYKKLEYMKLFYLGEFHFELLEPEEMFSLVSTDDLEVKEDASIELKSSANYKAAKLQQQNLCQTNVF